MSSIYDEMALVVEVKEGKLKGKENTSVLSGKKFYTFQGIPYAKPPVGELRFQPPVPITTYNGLYDATYERNSCIRFDDIVSTALVGSEDCLYLNISTPEIPAEVKIPKPVMVFIHGGTFYWQSGSEELYSADFLMDYDVILVTLNYRLHILGFLNLALPNCPGNSGLKDQVMALKWVKENIQAFGGDTKNITLIGQSAGATCVHYHMISPMSKGLFHKAIMQSGSALSVWGLISRPSDIAFQFGAEMGFKGNTPEDLLRFLKKQDASDLTKFALKMFNDTKNRYPATCNTIPMSPSIEEIKNGAFLPDAPEKLLEKADPIPVIAGVNDREGALILMFLSENGLEAIRSDFSAVLNCNFDVDPDVLTDLTRRVKNYYFGVGDITIRNLEPLINMYSDIFFYRFYDAFNYLQHSQMPVYVYEFSYDGNLRVIPKPEILVKTKIKGALHGDEVRYLFHAKIKPNQKIEGDDLKVLRYMTSMWTNFAKTGNPSNYDIDWKPYTPSCPYLLKINSKLKLVEERINNCRIDDLKTILGSFISPSNPI